MQFSLVVLSGSAQPTLPYADADNFEQAVAMIAVEMRAIEESRLYCGREVEKERRYFDHYALLWETQNEEEILAVETRLGRRTDRAQFESLRDSAVSASMAAFRAMLRPLGQKNFVRRHSKPSSPVIATSRSRLRRHRSF